MLLCVVACGCLRSIYRRLAIYVYLTWHAVLPHMVICNVSRNSFCVFTWVTWLFGLYVCRSIFTALITLFQLFTLDHWLEVFNDATAVSNYVFAFFYIIFWILIGSFIFRNIFVGIMGNLWLRFWCYESTLIRHVCHKNLINMVDLASVKNKNANNCTTIFIKTSYIAPITTCITVLLSTMM